MKEKNKFYKTGVDWRAVTNEVNKRLKSSYPVNYIQNIYNGLQQSQSIKRELDDILKGV